MELSQNDKETLVRAISFYYENYVWGDLLSKDNGEESDEDYNLRNIVQKLNLELPERIKQRF